MRKIETTQSGRPRAEKEKSGKNDLKVSFKEERSLNSLTVYPDKVR